MRLLLILHWLGEEKRMWYLADSSIRIIQSCITYFLCIFWPHTLKAKLCKTLICVSIDSLLSVTHMMGKRLIFVLFHLKGNTTEPRIFRRYSVWECQWSHLCRFFNRSHFLGNVKISQKGVKAGHKGVTTKL